MLCRMSDGNKPFTNLKTELSMNRGFQNNTQIYHGIEDPEMIPEILETGELRAVEFVRKGEITTADKIKLDLMRNGGVYWEQAESIIEESLEYFEAEAHPETLEAFQKGSLQQILEDEADKVEVGDRTTLLHETKARTLCAYFTEFEGLAMDYAGERSGYFEMIVPEDSVGGQNPRHIQIPEGVPLEYASVLNISREFVEDDEDRFSKVKNAVDGYPSMRLEIYDHLTMQDAVYRD